MTKSSCVETQLTDTGRKHEGLTENSTAEQQACNKMLDELFGKLDSTKPVQILPAHDAISGAKSKEMPEQILPYRDHNFGDKSLPSPESLLPYHTQK